ncbi:hypothetical protein D3C84_588730 [compost metagenome]
MVIREIAVDFAEQRDDFAVQGFDQLRGDNAGCAVPAIDHYFQATSELDVLDDFSGVTIKDFDLGDAALTAGQVVGFQALMQGLNLFVGQCVARDDDFKTVVVRWVVATGEHYAGFASQYVGGVVERRGWYQADVADVAPAICQALDQLLDKLRTRQATVAADADVRFTLGQGLGANGATDPVGGFSGQGVRDHATDIVGAKDAVGERGGDAGCVAHTGIAPTQRLLDGPASSSAAGSN